MCCRRTPPLTFFSFNQNMLLVELKGETLFRKKKGIEKKGKKITKYYTQRSISLHLMSEKLS